MDPSSLPRREYILETLKEFEPFSSVLDIGCGYGDDLVLIKEKYPEVEICGIEKDSDKARGSKYILNVDVSIIQDNRMFKDNSIDMIISDAAVRIFV